MTVRQLDELEKAINEEGGWVLVEEHVGNTDERELISAKRCGDVFTVTSKVTMLQTKVYERRD